MCRGKKTLAHKQKIKPLQQPFAKQWPYGQKLYIHDTESILIENIMLEFSLF